MIPKTLSMIKMEKNFRAHIEKKYPRMPYAEYGLAFWLYRIRQETDELETAIGTLDYEEVRKELADLSNLVDYAFERSLIEEAEPAEHSLQLKNQGLQQLFEHNKRLKEEPKL